MSTGDKVFAEILGETRELNRKIQQLDGIKELALAVREQNKLLNELVTCHRENRQALDQMAGYLKDYQGVVDFALKDAARNNQTLTFDIYLKPELHNSELYGCKSDGAWQPLVTDDRGHLVLGSPAEQSAAQGKLFIVNTGTRMVSKYGFLVLQLTNPAESGRILRLKQAVGGGEQMMMLDILGNASFAGGNALTPFNTNLGSGITSAATVKWITANQNEDPTTGGDLLWTYIINSPDKGGSREIDLNGLVIMPPNSTLVVRVFNDTPKSNAYFAACLSFEEHNI